MLTYGTSWLPLDPSGAATFMKTTAILISTIDVSERTDHVIWSAFTDSRTDSPVRSLPLHSICNDCQKVFEILPSVPPPHFCSTWSVPAGKSMWNYVSETVEQVVGARWPTFFESDPIICEFDGLRWYGTKQCQEAEIVEKHDNFVSRIKPCTNEYLFQRDCSKLPL